MKKTAQVHLVATNNPSKLGFCFADNKLELSDNPIEQQALYQPQHLYFTDNSMIEERDWYLDTVNKIPRQCTNGLWGEQAPITCKKVIATTNPELWNAMPIKTGSKTLKEIDVAKIPTSFVEYYIQHPVKSVELLLMCFDNCSGKEIEDDDYIDNFSNGMLKLTPNGEVIWSVEEEKMYTRAEVKKIAELAYDRGTNDGSDDINSWNKDDFETWFNKNYPQ